MAKRTVDPKPTFVKDSNNPKYEKFKKDYKGGRNATDMKNAAKASNGFFSGGPAPRTGAAKAPAKVSKPSRVQSGISLKKKK